MNIPENSVAVFGTPSSQPTRTVYWFCMMSGTPFAFVSAVNENWKDGEGMGNTHIGVGFDEDEAVRQMRKVSPLGKVPAVVIGDFALSESLVVVSYLCDKFGLEDYYPKDLEVRAKINQYLHMHETFTRQATAKLMAPHVNDAWGGIAPAETALDETHYEMIGSIMAKEDKLASGRKIVDKVASVINDTFLQDDHPYLIGQDHVTVADIACYEELRQLEWAGLMDFSPYARLQAWFQTMEKLPHHDVAHHYNSVLGDICNEPITLLRFMHASIAGNQAIREAGFPVVSPEVLLG